jgi:F-type H+-transporting ATPase subunit a
MMKAILAAIILFVAPVLLLAAEPERAVTTAAVVEHESGPLVSAGALPIFPNVPWLTNSMIYTLVIGAIILVIIRLGTRNMKEIPSGLQNVIEAAVEGLENLTKAKVARWCFPLVATYFIFIVFSNLMGLLPGVGSIGYGPVAKDSSMPFAIEHAVVPFLRPPTADANMTIAMSLIFFIMSTYWAIKYNGVWGLIKHIFGPKGGLKGPILIPLSIIFALVGVIEVVSLLIRPVALAMRLYGNIYGGESVLALMLHKCYGLAAVPFYFLEFVVAIVQAMVFTILCIAFISTLCSHDEEEGHAKEH